MNGRSEGGEEDAGGELGAAEASKRDTWLLIGLLAAGQQVRASPPPISTVEPGSDTCPGG